MTGWLGVVANSRIYSVGYEGFTADALVTRLAQAHVAVLYDVRLNAVSRRPGFSKRRLAESCAVAGIEYVHEPLLGNPQDNREAYRRGDSGARQRMRRRLRNGSAQALRDLVDIARRRRVAVMCVERDRLICHRDVVTEMAVELDPSIEVVHIL